MKNKKQHPLSRESLGDATVRSLDRVGGKFIYGLFPDPDWISTGLIDLTDGLTKSNDLTDSIERRLGMTELHRPIQYRSTCTQFPSVSGTKKGQK